MSIKDAILATIAAEPGGEVLGRTLLQKKLYFLSILVGDDFDFAPHFYGPYSARLADELDALVAAGLVKEEVEPLPEAGGPFAERRRYRYGQNDSGRAVLKSRAAEAQRYVGALEKINAHSIARNVYLLAAAAKVHLIVAERGRASVLQIRERAAQLGWNLGEREINRVVEYLEHLQLVGQH